MHRSTPVRSHWPQTWCVLVVGVGASLSLADHAHRKWRIGLGRWCHCAILGPGWWSRWSGLLRRNGPGGVVRPWCYGFCVRVKEEARGPNALKAGEKGGKVQLPAGMRKSNDEQGAGFPCFFLFFFFSACFFWRLWISDLVPFRNLIPVGGDKAVF